MKRILLAALLGGLVAFAWSAIDHMVLPVGSAGIRQLPQEDALLQSMRELVPESGLYFFPGMDMRGGASKEEQEAWEAKMRTGPDGMLLYHAGGGVGMTPMLFIKEFLSDVIAALIAALVIAQLGPGRLRRALTVMLMGLFSWFAISFSYWNWYGFPGSFILAEGFDQVVSWFLAGLAMAGVMKASSRERRFS
jgi:hypothetical protein